MVRYWAVVCLYLIKQVEGIIIQQSGFKTQSVIQYEFTTIYGMIDNFQTILKLSFYKSIMALDWI